jgi:hypothetical protein
LHQRVDTSTSEREIILQKMACDCRRPINCYNDKTRYKTMVVLHTLDLIFFIVRLALVSNDISKNVSNTMGFLIPILLFDLIGSVPIIICNIIYLIIRHCIKPLIREHSSFPCLWRFGTMTCIRLPCHNDRPQAILLMRIIFIMCSFILRFICFVIGASCSARFKSQCTAYAIIAAFALVSSIFVIIVEFVHFFRLWTYNPTDTRNTDKTNQISPFISATRVTKTHRRHLHFIHHSLLNDQTSQAFRQSICEKGIDCQSQSLHHHLLYHSLESERNIESTISDDNLKKSFIAFYQTTKQVALDIAVNGFPYGDNINSPLKEFLHLNPNIYFTPSCTQNLNDEEAIICVRLNLGRVVTTDVPNLHEYFGGADGKYDTVYVKSKGQFYLRMPAQIEKWIIAINANVPVNDVLEGTFYQPCL